MIRKEKADFVGYRLFLALFCFLKRFFAYTNVEHFFFHHRPYLSIEIALLYF